MSTTAVAAASAMGKSLLGSFSRAKQLTEEKLLKGDKTEVDPHFEALANRTDRIKSESDVLLKEIAAYLQPNPTRRLENTVYKKLNRRIKEHMSEVEVLGDAMLNAAISLGSQTPFGRALEQTGLTQKKLGDLWAAQQDSVDDGVVRPLRALLDSDVKQALVERKALERVRLDLDAARSRARRTPESKSIEHEVAEAQALYDQQYEITKLMLEAVQRRNEDGVHRLLAFVNAQRAYFSAADTVTSELAAALRELLGSTGAAARGDGPRRPMPPRPAAASSTSGTTTSSGAGSGDTVGAPYVIEATPPPAPPATTFVRVLCDYDAANDQELSLVAGEVIAVHRDAALPSGWVVGQRNGHAGKVSTAYLDMK